MCIAMKGAGANVSTAPSGRPTPTVNDPDGSLKPMGGLIEFSGDLG